MAKKKKKEEMNENTKQELIILRETHIVGGNDASASGSEKAWRRLRSSNNELRVCNLQERKFSWRPSAQRCHRVLVTVHHLQAAVGSGLTISRVISGQHLPAFLFLTSVLPLFSVYRTSLSPLFPSDTDCVPRGCDVCVHIVYKLVMVCAGIASLRSYKV